MEESQEGIAISRNGEAVKMTLATLWACLAEKGIPEPVSEFRFHPTRKWRFDWCFPERRLAVECDGALYVQGRHSRGAGREKDMEKLAEALCLGWRVLVVSPRHIENGAALDWICRLYHREPVIAEPGEWRLKSEIIKPICWLCKKEIKGVVHYQAEQPDLPSHKKCLVEVKVARDGGF